MIGARLFTIVVLSVVCLAGMGVAFGVGLAFAAKRFHIGTDPRVDGVLEVLPGVNCGSCGYAGCAGYAAAVAECPMHTFVDQRQVAALPQ